MRMIFGDFETYWDDEFTLRKLTPVQYILDPRFAVHGAAICDGDNPAMWMDDSTLQLFLAGVDWSTTAFISHNALFDASIMAWHYLHDPVMIIDTMGMARALVYHETGSVSLDTISKYFGLTPKGNVVHKTKGLSTKEIQNTSWLYNELKDYGMDDVTNCRSAFMKMSKTFPIEEYMVNHIVCKMATKPQFVLDQTLLAQHLHEVEQEKIALLDRCGMTHRDDLMSNDKFAGVLRSLGVEPPTKISKVTGKETYAFAKSDEDFTNLETHPDSRVQSLVAARMGVKSTIEQTRSKRLIEISNLSWGEYGVKRKLENMMPIPLRYSGAHTHRLSGDWKLNEQNLTRGGNLRKAHKAPDEHVVISCDESQIEARIVAWMAEQHDLIAQFARGEDVYCNFATDVFGYEVIKKTHPMERFIAKQAILGLGFGMAAPRFEAQLKAESYKQGIEVDIPLGMPEKVVSHYRNKYPRIPKLWKRGEGLFLNMVRGEEVTLGPIKTEFEAIVLPSGLKLKYRELKVVQNHDAKYFTQEWWYQYGKTRKKLFGGKVTENYVQALARIIVMDAAVRIHNRLPWLDLAHQVHDELIYVVPVETFDEVSGVVLEEMSKRPWWGPDLPVAAELNYGPSYGECK